MADLSDLKRPGRQNRDRKRVGRGPGSGTGKTAGRGHKGSKARSGSKGPGGGKPFFEGGQQPMQRRLPKRGFTPPNRVRPQTVNLRDLDQLPGDEVSPEILKDSGLVRSANRPVKVLGDGELTRSLRVSAHAFTRSAREKIEGAGGSIEELS